MKNEDKDVISNHAFERHEVQFKGLDIEILISPNPNGPPKKVLYILDPSPVTIWF